MNMEILSSTVRDNCGGPSVLVRRPHRLWTGQAVDIEPDLAVPATQPAAVGLGASERQLARSEQTGVGTRRAEKRPQAVGQDPHSRQIRDR